MCLFCMLFVWELLTNRNNIYTLYIHIYIWCMFVSQQTILFMLCMWEAENIVLKKKTLGESSFTKKIHNIKSMDMYNKYSNSLFKRSF